MRAAVLERPAPPARAVAGSTTLAQRPRRGDLDAAVAAGLRAGERLARTPLSPSQRALLERAFRR